MIFSEVVNYFNKLYPFKNAEEWDQVGLQLGNLNQEISGIVIALDLTSDVMELAKKEQANLIITHHPFLFNEKWIDDLKESPYKEKIYKDLKAKQMGVLALHTNYDKTNKQTTTIIAKKLGLKPYVSKTNYGHLFHKQITKKELEMLLQAKLELKIIESNLNPQKTYKKWGLLPGAGDSIEIAKLHNEGAEFVITSDIKWSTWITAKNTNFGLVQISHAVEDLFTSDIFLTIKKQWNKIRVIKKAILR